MRFGLIGHPLTGSGSPALFAKAYGGRWPYDLIDEPEFEAAWGRFLADYEAVNVTTPFKLAAFERVAASGRLSEDAVACGAVNIVVKESSGDAAVRPGDDGSVCPGDGGSAPLLAGYNSDYLGLKALLSAEGFGAGDVAVVAGFGGAGRAAAAAARALGMDVVVCNRTVAAPGGGLPDPVSPAQIRPLAELPVLAGVADILIYTLPVAVPEIEGLNVPVVLEANYVSPCLENYGGRYISGRRWLLEQARAGYEIMTGEKCLSLS